LKRGITRRIERLAPAVKNTEDPHLANGTRLRSSDDGVGTHPGARFAYISDTISWQHRAHEPFPVSFEADGGVLDASTPQNSNTSYTTKGADARRLENVFMLTRLSESTAVRQRRGQTMTRKMKVVFFHPDLGLGGAERLVVDAAVGLQKRGHSVRVYTSYYDPERAFDDIVTEGLEVHVYGSIPASPAIGFYIFIAICRQLLLTVAYLYKLHITKVETPADIIFVDQLPAAIPLLRWCTSSRILYYGHFPDALLAPRDTALKKVYRWPFDTLEQLTTCTLSSSSPSDAFFLIRWFICIRFGASVHCELSIYCAYLLGIIPLAEGLADRIIPCYQPRSLQ